MLTINKGNIQINKWITFVMFAYKIIIICNNIYL